MNSQQGSLGHVFQTLVAIPAKTLINSPLAVGFGLIDIGLGMVAGMLPIPGGNAMFREIVGSTIGGLGTVAKMELYNEVALK